MQFAMPLETASFVNASARRVAMMKQCLDTIPETKRHRVKQLCTTRWVKHHDAVTSFTDLYPAILRCLEQCVDELTDVKTAATARMLLHAIQQPEFVVSAHVLGNVLNLTHGLVELLQSIHHDLLTAIAYVHDLNAVLPRKWEAADESFLNMWQQARHGRSVWHRTHSLPRLNNHHRLRANVPAESPEEYFKRSLF